MLVSLPAIPSVVSFRSPWGEVLSGRVRVVHYSPSVLIGDAFDEAEFPLYEVEVDRGSAPGMWNVPSGWVLSAPFVWVAHVPTYYKVVGVGGTRDEAIRVACQRAWEFLDDRDCLTEETSTPEKIADWFGVSAVCVKIGEGVVYE